jgi:hypothetical protein
LYPFKTPHALTTQMMNYDIFIAVRTSSLTLLYMCTREGKRACSGSSTFEKLHLILSISYYSSFNLFGTCFRYLSSKTK